MIHYSYKNVNPKKFNKGAFFSERGVCMHTENVIVQKKRYAPTGYGVDLPIAFDVRVLGNDTFLPGHIAILGGDKFLTESTNYHHFEYITEGKGYIETDGERHKVSAGDFFFMKKSLYRTITADSKIPMKKYFLTARGAFADGTLSAYFPKKSCIICRCNVSEYFQNMMELCEANESDSNELYDKLAMEFLKMIQTVSKALTKDSDAQNGVSADAIMSYLDENINIDFSLQDVAEAFFLTQSNLVIIFKEKYNTTPMNIVRGRRIALAKHYLKETNLPIAQIAKLVPLGNIKYFSKLFKKFTGLSPREYRNKKQK